MLRAKPMTLGEYNNIRGWKIPENEDPARKGYLVEYKDGGEPNVEGFEGYISWSPEVVFDNSYARTNRMGFGHALFLVRRGEKVSRGKWNDKSMYVFADNKLCLYVNSGEGVTSVFSPSQEDMYAHDWYQLETPT